MQLLVCVTLVSAFAVYVSGAALDGPKVGLAWANGNNIPLTNFLTPHVGAIHTWSPHCPDGSNSIQCYQMLWGADSGRITDFNNTVKPAGGNKNVILGFNEPNEAGQSNLSPQVACIFWHSIIEPRAKEGYTLVSPATSNAPGGIQWMQQFFQCCSDCTVNAMAVHWFGTSVSSFESWVSQWHVVFNNRDVLVTEYGFQDFNGQQHSADEVVAFYKSVGFIPSPQSGNPAALMTADGQPTALGLMILNEAY
ncbi:unnamed protein product [Somion occarium]|uniref:Asl1-like glycosyl hydrolase catalytic domain-containing protein n=1 Tax=Somion occarium TaxID=3059160 RepID=A0ABP1DVT3_9APHY